MVTRTVELTVCNCWCMDIDTASIIEKTFEVGGGLTEEKQLLKAIQKQHETDSFKVVTLEKVCTIEILYGMPEAQFIELATILPPRGTKQDEE